MTKIYFLKNSKRFISPLNLYMKSFLDNFVIIIKMIILFCNLHYYYQL